MKKERGVLMNGDMVRASLDGRKTQTRRLLKPQPAWEVGKSLHFKMVDGLMRAFIGDRICKTPYYTPPLGKVGDLLYVRERARLIDTGYAGVPTGTFQYEADGKITKEIEIPGRLKPIKPGNCCANGCFKEIARIWLEITGVRVERVQDINKMAALHEGVKWKAIETWTHQDYLARAVPHEQEIIPLFKKLWESCYPGSWERNDWVWVYEFKRIEKSA